MDRGCYVTYRFEDKYVFMLWRVHKVNRMKNEHFILSFILNFVHSSANL